MPALSRWPLVCFPFSLVPFSGRPLYTSDAPDDLLCVALGGRRINKKKKFGFRAVRSV